jgi:DNA-binding transcriptional LysR family regulator
MNRAFQDWSLCRSFLATLRAGSLSRAAQRLGVTHPTLRRHIEEMEAGLGAPLFVRSPSGLAPTELALGLRDAAEAMEAAFERLQRAGSATGDAVAGTVRITASEIVGTEVLPPMLARLRTAHPGLSFELDLTDDLVDLLRRDADIALRMSRPAQSELVARRAACVPLGVFAHQAWLEAHGTPASLAELIRDRQLIGHDRDPTLIEALAGQGIAAERRDFGFRSDSTLAQLAALRAGLGVGICQVPIAARDPALVWLFPELRSELDIWVVSHPSLRSSRAVRACVDALAHDLAGYVRGGERERRRGA